MFGYSCWSFQNRSCEQLSILIKCRIAGVPATVLIDSPDSIGFSRTTSIAHHAYLADATIGSRSAVLATSGVLPNADMAETMPHRLLSLINIPQIDQNGIAHDSLKARQVERTELFPFGHNHKR